MFPLEVICCTDTNPVSLLNNSPTTVDELQRALKVVNNYKIPVWTVSRGKNLG